MVLQAHTPTIKSSSPDSRSAPGGDFLNFSSFWHFFLFGPGRRGKRFLGPVSPPVHLSGGRGTQIGPFGGHFWSTIASLGPCLVFIWPGSRGKRFLGPVSPPEHLSGGRGTKIGPFGGHFWSTIASLGPFWRFLAPRVGGNESSDPFHPQCTCPEVGGPKSDYLGAIFGFWAPLKSRSPLQVDRHGGPCRIRSTFKGGCVLCK